MVSATTPRRVVRPGDHELPLEQIRRDGGTQVREALDEAHVERLVEVYREGTLRDAPKLIVYCDGEHYWLADGFHRLEALVRLERSRAWCEVRAGTQREAQLYSKGANADHGLPRSRADKRRAVVSMLEDPEWSTWGDRAIARATNTTHPYVGKLRAELAAEAAAQAGGNVSTPEPPQPEVVTEAEVTERDPGSAGALADGEIERDAKLLLELMRAWDSPELPDLSTLQVQLEKTLDERGLLGPGGLHISQLRAAVARGQINGWWVYANPGCTLLRLTRDTDPDTAAPAAALEHQAEGDARDLAAARDERDVQTILRILWGLWEPKNVPGKDVGHPINGDCIEDRWHEELDLTHSEYERFGAAALAGERRGLWTIKGGTWRLPEGPPFVLPTPHVLDREIDAMLRLLTDPERRTPPLRDLRTRLAAELGRDELSTDRWVRLLRRAEAAELVQLMGQRAWLRPPGRKRVDALLAASKDDPHTDPDTDETEDELDEDPDRSDSDPDLESDLILIRSALSALEAGAAGAPFREQTVLERFCALAEYDEIDEQRWEARLQAGSDRLWWRRSGGVLRLVQLEGARAAPPALPPDEPTPLPNSQRAAGDAYYTPEAHARALVRWLDERLFAGSPPASVRESAVGGGAWLAAAMDAWPDATLTGVDIDPGAVGLQLAHQAHVGDFRELELRRVDLDLGNPPYAGDLVGWIDRARQNATVVAYLLRGSLLDGAERWQQRRPAHVIVVSPRPLWEGPGARPSADMQPSIFVVWVHGHPGPTQLHWLDVREVP